MVSCLSPARSQKMKYLNSSFSEFPIHTHLAHQHDMFELGSQRQPEHHLAWAHLGAYAFEMGLGGACSSGGLVRWD